MTPRPVTTFEARPLVPSAHVDGPIVCCPRCGVLDRMRGHVCDPETVAAYRRACQRAESGR